MMLTSLDVVDFQECSPSKMKKAKLMEEISHSGKDTCSKGTHSDEFPHEQKPSCLHHATSQISEINLKQAQHFPNIQRSVQQNLHKEWWRLLTFSRYPSKAQCSSILLARQGFIYCGTGDSLDYTVMCVFCSSLVRNLDENVPIEEMHSALNPDCPVVQGFKVRNMPMKECSEGKFDEIFAQLHQLGKVKPSQSPQYHNQQIKNFVAPVSNITSSQSQNIASDNDRQISCNSNQLFASYEGAHDSMKQQDGTSQLITNHALSLSLPWQDRSQNQERPANYTVNNASERLFQNQARPDAIPFELETSPASYTTPASTASLTEERQNGPNGNLLSSELQPQNRSSGSVERPQNQGSNPSYSTASNNSSVPLDLSAVPNSSHDQNGRDEEMQRSNPSYDELGIITSHPKRPEYAIEVNRLESFQGWPADHHIQPEDLARAGYFFTGYSDCARCFHCGGGLRNWELGDNIWVEHARWFPKCAFMRQSMGQAFIDVVQHLNKEQEMISFDDVMREMESRSLDNSLPKGIEDNMLEIRRDAAVRVIVNNGFSEEEAVKAAQTVRRQDQLLSADLIYEELFKQGVTRHSDVRKNFIESQSVNKRRNEKQDRETIESIKDKISEMRRLTVCKICMDKEVSVIFLPCSHFVSCNDCSFALRYCPFCRENIKGAVRAFLN